MRETLYAIGDVHGQLEMLINMHRRIFDDAHKNNTTAKVIHLGDYIDRGPESAGVIQYLIDGHQRGENWVSIKGNHDLYLELFCQNPHERGSSARHLHWFNPRLGGDATMRSYGIDVVLDRDDNDARAVDIEAIATRAAQVVPQRHLDFLRALPYTFRHGRVLFVHAGIRPNIPIHEQKIDDMLWIRDPFFEHKDDFGALIVHGHTIYDQITHFGNRIGVDTGAGKGAELSCLIIEDNALYDLQPSGRVEVTPPKGWTLWGQRH